MERNTVTRTFSIGAICSGAKAVHSEDLFAARRHSSAGIRALLWANNSAKLFGCSLGSDSQTSLENIFPNILTPDSIPQFTIPNLSVQSSLRSLDNREDDEECEEGYGSCETEQKSSLSSSVTCSSLSSSSSSSSGFIVSERKAERSVSDPFNQRRLLQRDGSLSSAHTNAHQCLDPASRAALSLPHLPKVTTPYGFVTLSQSPQMASEEALLCQAGLRRFRDEGAVCCPTKAPLTRTGNSHVKVNPSHLSAFKQKLSKDSAASHSKGRLTNTDFETFSATSASSSVTPSQTDGRFKSRFREIIRKHFSSRNRDRLT